MTEHIASTKRYKRLAQRRKPAGGIQSVSHRNDSFRDSSNIEASVRWNETNLPAWLLPYVQNRSWAIRFANLLDQGYHTASSGTWSITSPALRTQTQYT
jgi:hypothetical protein